MSGKTTFCRHFMNYGTKGFDKEIEEIYFVYRYQQHFFLDYSFITLTKENSKLLDARRRSLVTFDDCGSDNEWLTDIANFFSAVSHLLNATAIFITQNWFLNNSTFWTISQNATAIAIFLFTQNKVPNKNYSR